MRQYILEVLPDAKVKAFGSISSELCLQRSGLDLTILVPEPADHKDIMDKIAAQLETKPGKLNYNNKGKYPVARFTNEHKMGLCLTVNNFLGIANSKMLKKYVALDPRVKIMCNIIKYWAKESSLAIPSQGFISSYAWTMLVISFLQTQNPPIIPSLQSSPHEAILRDNADIWFDKTSTFRSQNTTNIGTLLVYFFYHYSVVVPALPNVQANIREGCL